MSFSITVGNRNITSLGPLKDLQSNIESDFKLGPELEGQLDKPLSTLPANLRSVAIAGDGSPSWSPGNGEFTFSLTAGVSGSLSVYLGGDTLLSYVDDFETDISIGPEAPADPPTPKTVSVPSGAAYICLDLGFKIGGGLSATVPVGTVGVFGSVSDQNTFGNAFYRKCSPSVTLQQAIQDVFSNYVLPLHPLTLTNLDVGDYLHHHFNANLQVGLGASIGYDKLFYAAQSPVDIPGTGGAVTLDTSFIPSFEAAATLSFSFDYTGSFSALLWKDTATLGHLHLHRSKEVDKGVDLQFAVGLTSDPETSAANMSSQFGTFLGKFLPGSLGKKLASKAGDEINNFADDGAKKIEGWLEPVNEGMATLDFAIESTKQSFLLLDYTFDLTAPAFATAWKTAVDGDFVAALKTPNGGVSIGVGGGLEKFYSRKTSVSLNIFGQLNATWSDAIIDNSSMIYAGNNTFHVMAQEGRQQLALVNNSKREIDIYFAAEADLSSGGTKLGEIELHCVLLATNNAKYGNYLANFLNLMTPAVGQAALANSIASLAAVQGATEMIHLIFDQSSYGLLQASTITKGKPDNQVPDQQNYAAFAKACSDLFNTSPANFSYNGQSLGYTIWSNWNIASNDKWPPSAGAVPDRTQPGNTVSGTNAYIVGNEFPQANQTDATLISYALQAASDFMNFCADLKSLVAFTAAGGGQDPWGDLVATLKSIIHNDVSQDFVAPASLALTWLCAGGRPPAEIGGPAPGLTDQNSIAVTVTYS
jgi:hypothetical protein